MEAMEALLTRRSIRSYTDQSIPDGIMEDLLEAAMAAPSAGNQQPWHFVVTEDRSRMEAIASYHRYAQMLNDAAAAVLVCGDTRDAKHVDYWVQDCSAATQNILLAAHAVGLGAVWLGIYPNAERVQRTSALFDLPDGVLPLCCIAMGYPAEEKGPSDRFDADRIHRDHW